MALERVALDSSCLVAGLCAWHERHAVTAGVLAELFEQLVVPAHALLETYSVLTRLPAPHRLSGETAWELLRENFEGTAKPALTGREEWKLLGRLAGEKVEGGRVYDALIVAAARKAGARLLLTWNLRHFAGLADEELMVAAPDGVG